MTLQNDNRVRADSDQDLLNQAARGNDQAVAMLYRRHHALVHGFTRRLLRDAQEVEEVVQDVFVALFRKPEAFNGMSSLSTYMCGIARRKALDRDRLRGRMPATEPIDDDNAAQVIDENLYADVVQQVGRRQALIHIEACMDKLPLAQREALFWTYFEDERDHEVAERQGVSPGTVKSRLNAARQAMKRCLSLRAYGGTLE